MTREITLREMELLLLVAQGRTIREASEEIGMAYTTGKTHMAKALAKLGARNQAHAIAILCERGAL